MAALTASNSPMRHNHGHTVEPGRSEVVWKGGGTGQSIRFELIDKNGAPVTENSFRGKRLVLTFGFTGCQHVCPMIVAKIASAIRGEVDVAGVFVSVDSERDTPETVGAYADGFGGTLVGLTGSFRQIGSAVESFGAAYSVTKTEREYTVQHSSSIFVVSGDSKIIAVLPATAGVDAIRQAVRQAE